MVFFGYISENAIVKNFKILNAFVRDKALRIDDNVLTVTVNESTNLISLNSIKRGAGDVNIGVLAGVNNGTIENVVMSAKVVYASMIRPDVYLVQNKSDQNGGNKMLISQDILEAKIDNRFTATSALSSYKNFCYPTPLCLNSEANLIPYVGYFNEGCFNSRTRDIDFSSTGTSNQFQPPLYRTYTSGGKVYDDHKSNFNYMGDIFTLYDSTHTGKHYKPADKFLFGSTNAETVDDVSQLHAMSFRLGPNNKAAFLIGGLVGKNNGDMTNVSTVNTLTFNENTVALIGGIAGRGARGKLKNVNARTSFFGSSGMYEDYLTIEDNTATEPEYSSTIYLSGIENHIYEGRLDANNEQGIPITFTNVNYNLVNMDSESSRLDARLHMQPYGYFYVNESTQPSNYSKFSGYTYDTLNVNIAPTTIKIPLISYYSGDDPQIQALSNVTATVTDISITDGYYRVSTSNSKVITDVIEYSAAELQGDVPTPIQSVSSFNIAAEEPYLTVTYSSDVLNGMFGSFTLPVSALSNPIELDSTSLTKLSKQKFVQTSASMDVKLSPVYNIGGMFGEYVYSDGQSITDSTVFACVKNFQPEKHYNELYHYKNVNKVAEFACNCIFDSANKSNENAYEFSRAASADTLLQNNLKCTAILVTVDMNDIWHRNDTFTDMYCEDLKNTGRDKIQYIHYLQCYNMISPALIGTNYCDQSHKEGENYPVNLGILYEDQIFFKYGLNMGSDLPYGDDYSLDTISKVRERISSLSGAGSGCYFHYPAQASAHDILNTSTNTSNENMWSYNTILTAAYNLSSVHASATTAYVSKQLTAYPQHYGLYRGRASLHADNDHHFSATFDENDYLKVSYDAPQIVVNSSATFFAPATAMIDTLDQMKPNLNPYYTYSYSSVEYDKSTIKPVPMHVKYLDNVCNDPNSYELYGTPDEISAAKYVMSSDNYQDFYVANSITLATAEVRQLTATCLSGLSGIPEVVITTTASPVFEVNEKSRNSVIGRITFKPLTTQYSDFVIDNVDTSRYVDGENASVKYKQNLVCVDQEGYIHINGAQIKNEDKFNNEVYEDDQYTGYAAVPGIVRASFKIEYNDANNVSHVEQFIIHIRIIESIPDTSVKLYYNELDESDKNVVSSNALIYSYVPNSAAIVNLLNNINRDSIVCTGLKADDLQYALIVDENQCPVMDIRLDSNGAENEGYNIQFNRVGKVTKSSSNPPTYEFTYSGGSLINISGAK